MARQTVWRLRILMLSVIWTHTSGSTGTERHSFRSGLMAVFGNGVDDVTGSKSNSSRQLNYAKDWGEWSSWSPWTPCSTSCGLGVTKQTRQCIRKSANVKRNAFYKRQRLKRVSDVDVKCRGPEEETRYHVCNKQLCPNSTDLRETQCASFNEKLFNGKKYTWSAYYRATNQCALNCRAIGYRFYATLKPAAVDGTLCYGTDNSTTTPYVCVEGKCKIVGCDGSVGGQKRFDACGVCGGDNSTCRSISGIFTRPDMPAGYNVIARLPRSACNVTISELKPSANSIALKHTAGSYILNGNWTDSRSGDYEAAGTVFAYRKENGRFGEEIFAPGPLSEPIDLILVFRYLNPGVKYEYKLPVDEAIAAPLIRHHGHHSSSSFNGNYVRTAVNDETTDRDGENEDRKSIGDQPSYDAMPEYQGFIGDEAARPARNKGRKKKFMWKLTGYSECTVTCGGGYQTSTAVCVKEHNQQQQQQIVADKRCHGLDRPQPQVLRCNVKPCEGQWTFTEWSACSASCGLGVQTRRVVCRQLPAADSATTAVDASACPLPGPANVILSKVCQRPPCDFGQSADGNSHWVAGAWSKCSASCGVGIKSRTVGCSSAANECKPNEKPPHQTTCDAGPCAMALTNAGASWISSDWSQCSETCGMGLQTRKVHCSLGVDRENACDQSAKPEASRACLSDKDCSGLWFTGPWSQCSEKCGWGNQTRTLLCTSYDQKEWKIAPENRCSGREKPSATMTCFAENCGSNWFTSEWLPCSRSCDLGVQKRDVKCLNDVLKPSSDCEESNRPPNRRPCNLNNQCIGVTAHSAPATIDESRIKGEIKLTISSTTQQPSVQEDTNCVDMPQRNCNFVVQARLCSYKYYKTSCCNSCRNKA